MSQSFTWLPSAARTATVTSADIEVGGAKHLIVTVDITVIGTGSITLSINWKDVASGKYGLILASAALVGNATTRYKVSQNVITAAANVAAVDVLPEWIQLVMTANNANPVTYSVGYDLVN